jgi:hypothetical protein
MEYILDSSEENLHRWIIALISDDVPRILIP